MVSQKKGGGWVAGDFRTLFALITLGLVYRLNVQHADHYTMAAE